MFDFAFWGRLFGQKPTCDGLPRYVTRQRGATCWRFRLTRMRWSMGYWVYETRPDWDVTRRWFLDD